MNDENLSQKYTVKSIPLDGAGIKQNIEHANKDDGLLTILTNQEQRVVFIYGSTDNIYLGSVKGFFNHNFQDPVTLEGNNRRIARNHYPLLIVVYGPDIDISYKELVSDLFLELDSDTHHIKQHKSKRVILSHSNDFEVATNPNLIRKRDNWQKFVGRDNKDLSIHYPEILDAIWHKLYKNGHGYVNCATSNGIKNTLLQKYSPSISLDSQQTDIIKDICFIHTKNDHVIFGGAGTGKTLLMLHAADQISKNLDETTYLVTQGNCSAEFKELVQKTGNGEIKLDSLIQFTAKIADQLLYGTLRKPFVDTVFIDEAHNLPSFKKEQYGKTSSGFRLRAWEYRPKDDTKENKPKMAANLRQLFNAPPTDSEEEQCAKIEDYIDFLEFLKDNGYINRIILCYDEDQWVYSGSIARIEKFHTTSNPAIAMYHGHEFQTHRLYNQYRILSESGKNDKGTDFVTGIRTFLQLEPQKTEFRKDTFQHCEFNGAHIWRECDNPSYFGIVDSIAELFDYVNSMYEKHPGSHNRVVAGYARHWDKKHIDPTLSEEDKLAQKVWFDTTPRNKGDKRQGWAWNDKQEGFIFDEALEDRHREQVASIFSVQGIDLNYVGVIIADDIHYDNSTGTIVGVPENYKHRLGIIPKKLQKTDPNRFYSEFNKQIRGIYYTLMTRGINGVRFYFMDDDLKQHFLEFMGIHQPPFLHE
ncbi:hypothetical protein KIM372_14100 [Bombiscardovia nodaiensis]|uniref:Schlafen group 3-like DNA/RNA helicase domain-containing protein n=1 Tax=Bombiscardovia nodaiensis TaxID=2932181 RepID=A0ABM8BA94_9BIFI|nr:hypothetical protein KIM372_14100 [Bombiscardovia nodaiensis]